MAGGPEQAADPALVLILLILFLGLAALFGYRWIKNRPRRLLKRFIVRARKMPEVRAILRRQQQVIVVVDRAVANTYVRLNAAMDKVNEKRFFGDPFEVTIRDEVPAEMLRALLQNQSVLHVRDDALDDTKED